MRTAQGNEATIPKICQNADGVGLFPRGVSAKKERELTV